MTYAPTDLMEVRRELMAVTGLSGDAVGIVGDPEHAATGGYHEGNDDLARVGRLTTDYSKKHSARDRPGTNAASALDVGDGWKRGVGLRAWSLALVAAMTANERGTLDIREIIYSPDGKTVKRLDREGKSTTGDKSHLWHTHISFYRDSEGRRDGDFKALALALAAGTAPVTGGGGEDVASIGAYKGAYYVGDGVFHRPVIDWPERNNLIAMGAKEKLFSSEWEMFGAIGRLDGTALVTAVAALTAAVAAMATKVDLDPAELEAVKAAAAAGVGSGLAAAVEGLGQQITDAVTTKLGPALGEQVGEIVRGIFIDAGTKG